jgi:hypothetical protein
MASTILPHKLSSAASRTIVPMFGADKTSCGKKSSLITAPKSSEVLLHSSVDADAAVPSELLPPAAAIAPCLCASAAASSWSSARSNHTAAGTSSGEQRLLSAAQFALRQPPAAAGQLPPPSCALPTSPCSS